jgi:hypothetical protein
MLRFFNADESVRHVRPKKQNKPPAVSPAEAGDGQIEGLAKQGQVSQAKRLGSSTPNISSRQFRWDEYEVETTG